MIVLLQRVTRACVFVEQKIIAQCDKGLLVYVAIQSDEDQKRIDPLASKIVNYRIFADADDKMNLSVNDINGTILLIPQFTLAANTDKGLRPNFSSASTPQIAFALFDQLVKCVQSHHPATVSGQFQADMQIESVNDGPATFILS